LKKNLANDDPNQQDRLVDEFRTLMLGRRVWKEQDPDVPDGDWYKDFGTFKLCGTGKFPSTFSLAGHPRRHSPGLGRTDANLGKPGKPAFRPVGPAGKRVRSHDWLPPQESSRPSQEMWRVQRQAEACPT
jgi:hypothetical protein